VIDDRQQLVDRITELEIQLAHQQRICEQLNEVVVEHTQQMMRYERILIRMEDQVKSLREQRKEAFDPHQEKPPHY
jgi:SlyX protein